MLLLQNNHPCSSSSLRKAEEIGKQYVQIACGMQVMQLADRTLMEGLKAKCAMLLHPFVTPDVALPLLQQAMEMDNDRSGCAPLLKIKPCLAPRNIHPSSVSCLGISE